MYPGPVWSNGNRIAGNFGELRSGHFHSGIDYKTDEKEGKPVFAAADGFVSRVKLSSGGYGRAIYITHPGNMVTVYGHMRIFYPALEDTIRKKQAANRNYELEIFPDSTYFPLKMGDIIGYSGSTGSSKGPHIHFETRHSETEIPFNPELAGFPVYDTVAPRITALALYQPGPFGALMGSDRQLFELGRESPGGLPDTLQVPASFFVGFEASDMAGPDSNNLGIRAFSLYLDDSLIFNCRIDSFSFDETRMINAIIDYPFYQETGRRLVLCHLLKGNRLSFLKTQGGLIQLEGTGNHRLKLRVEDSSGNFDERVYNIRQSAGRATLTEKDGLLCLYGNAAKLFASYYSIQTSPQSFYEDMRLDYSVKEPAATPASCLSPVISVGPRGIPVHDPLLISIRPFPHPTIPNSRLIVVQIDSSGFMTGIPAKWEKGWMTFKTRSMGDFAIVADVTNPSAEKPFWEPDEYSGKMKLIIPLKSDISGITGYHCFINNQWAAAIINSRKNGLIIYPEDIPGTEESLKVRVALTDGAGNRGQNQFTVSMPQSGIK